jgi:outer membrane protein OmpA-like peptidoglycan-associated protein
MARDAASRIDFICFLFISAVIIMTGPRQASTSEVPSEAQILEALKSRTTRAPEPPEHRLEPDREELRFIEALRVRSARSLTVSERTRLGQIARDKPSIDIEIQFAYNSDEVGPKALRPLLALGRALSSSDLKGKIFLINGHTDAKGSAEYNQDLSERRAEAVKRVLIAEFGLQPDTLIAAGYGKMHLKNESNPLGAENRRVQIVNTEVQAAVTAR